MPWPAGCGPLLPLENHCKMKPLIPTHTNANLRGILWMIAAMAAFAIEDASIKAAAHGLPTGQTLLMFGVGGAVLFGLLASQGESQIFSRQAFSRVMRVRAVCELLGRLFYFLAITLTPLSSATAILQATPLIVVLGATLFFRETVGWVHWTAIAIGLLGVLLILRPTAGDFSALSLLAVIGTLGFAGRDLASRAAPKTLTTADLGVYGFLTVMVAGALIAVGTGQPFAWPSARQCLGVASAIAAGVFAYAALMKAMRSGAIATVTPFRYTRLIFGISLGVLLFGEHLDGPTIVGSVVVMSSGLFIAWQGRRTGK